MIHRYSSRRSPLKDFLAARLQGARRYDRIAGFFSSSLLEVAWRGPGTDDAGRRQDLCSGGLQLLPSTPGRSDRPGGQVGNAPRMVCFALRRDRRTHEGPASVGIWGNMGTLFTNYTKHGIRRKVL